MHENEMSKNQSKRAHTHTLIRWMQQHAGSDRSKNNDIIKNSNERETVYRDSGNTRIKCTQTKYVVNRECSRESNDRRKIKMLWYLFANAFFFFFPRFCLASILMKFIEIKFLHLFEWDRVTERERARFCSNIHEIQMNLFRRRLFLDLHLNVWCEPR